MNQLRNSVRKGNGEPDSQADLWIPKGSSRTVTREKRIIRVDGFDPDLVGVHAISPNSIVILGLRPGRTTVELNFEGEDKSGEKIVVAVGTKRFLGDLPSLPRPRAADNEPLLPGVRHSPTKPIGRRNAPRPDLRIQEGFVEIIKRKNNLARMAVGARSIIDIAQCSATELGITALKPGTTNIMLWYRGETEPERVIVEVFPAHEVFPAQQSRPQTGVRIVVGHVQLMKPDKKVAMIAVGSTSIIDIVQDTTTEYRIIGLKPGSTNIFVWFDGEAEPERVIVEVLPTQLPAGGDPFSSTGSKEADTAQRRMELALKKKVSLKIDDGTLLDVVRSLRDSVGINIAVDSPAIEQEGIRTDHKVSVHLEDVTLRSALKIILTPLNLAAHIQDEVLMITSLPRAKGIRTVIAYKVGDLISQDEDGTKNFDDLISLITTVIEPNSWQEVGGAGSIAANEPSMSLVIRQPRATHGEIQQLLSALRKWNPGDESATSGHDSQQTPNR
jgi:hypothetical protein